MVPVCMTNIYDNKLGKSKSQQRIRKKDTSEEAFKILRNMKKNTLNIFLRHANISSILALSEICLCLSES